METYVHIYSCVVNHASPLGGALRATLPQPGASPIDYMLLLGLTYSLASCPVRGAPSIRSLVAARPSLLYSTAPPLFPGLEPCRPRAACLSDAHLPSRAAA